MVSPSAVNKKLLEGGGGVSIAQSNLKSTANQMDGNDGNLLRKIILFVFFLIKHPILKVQE